MVVGARDDLPQSVCDAADLRTPQLPSYHENSVSTLIFFSKTAQKMSERALSSPLKSNKFSRLSTEITPIHTQKKGGDVGIGNLGTIANKYISHKMSEFNNYVYGGRYKKKPQRFVPNFSLHRVETRT